MTFAERRNLELDYIEWLNRESIINKVEIEDCALSVIGYLDSKGLINAKPTIENPNRIQIDYEFPKNGIRKDIINKLLCEFNETKEDFIFISIARSFERDEEMGKLIISKEILKRALDCFREEHTEEYYRLFNESCIRVRNKRG